APLLRAVDHGREWVVFLLLVTFAADTAAYFVGKSIGQTPLVPSISPSKTREGAVGGLIGAAVASLAANYVLGLNALAWEALILGVLIGIVGQLGDLAESRIKRLAGVKDSGVIIPGHGGLLDRLDSIVLNMVVVYYFVTWEILQNGLLY
ncbi:MAG: phosphatidate cytidylyltransferase, partial [Chloroflexi bacterium]|nr:phosphatidate cytidylyltransferase [Chloroflexota bacterium]